MATQPNPSPAGTTSPRPQKDSGNVWAWVFGVVLAGVLILGAGAWFVMQYLVHRIEVTKSGSTVEINLPSGSVKVAKDENADPGLPIYTGAKLAQAGGSVELSTPNEDSVNLTATHYRTIDPIEKVDAWYREELSSDFKREGPGVMIHKKDIAGIVVKSDDIAYISEKDDVLLVVALQKRFNGVEIALLRAGKQEAQ